MVSPTRLNRYAEKVETVQNRFGYISNWSQESLNAKTKFAIYKVTQDGIKAMIDIVAMCIKDKGSVVKDDFLISILYKKLE